MADIVLQEFEYWQGADIVEALNQSMPRCYEAVITMKWKYSTTKIGRR
jgi:hypothetical protein